MRFGLFGGATRSDGVTSNNEGYGDSQTYRDFVEYVVEAERLGFESVFLVEHHFTGNGQLSASLSLLAYLAGLTSRIRLGTAVTVLPWHNPVLLAEQAALVDVVSNGRLEFGVGRGYRPNEFHGFGIDTSEAQARFEEGFELVLKSWTSRERFSHDGRYWKFNDIVVEPQCRQSPHPPLWVAGGSEQSIRGAAKKGHRLLLDQFADVETVRQRVQWYRDEFGRNHGAVHSGEIGLTRGLLLLDGAKAASEREAEIDRRLAQIAMLQKTSQIPGAASTSESLLAGSRAVTETSTLLGPPDEVIARLKALEEVGVDYVLLNDGWGGIERLRLFAKEVMPSFMDEANTNRMKETRIAG